MQRYDDGCGTCGSVTKEVATMTYVKAVLVAGLLTQTMPLTAGSEVRQQLADYMKEVTAEAERQGELLATN